MTHVSAAVFDALRRALGSHAVDTSEETLVRYGRNLLPGGDRRPAGVVFPASTAEVQALVRIANDHRAPLYSVSTGENRGLGLRARSSPGTFLSMSVRACIASWTSTRRCVSPPSSRA